MRLSSCVFVCMVTMMSTCTNSIAQSGWFPLPNAPISLTGLGGGFTDVHFVNPDTGFVSGFFPQGFATFRTSDGGTSWSQLGYNIRKFKSLNQGRFIYAISDGFVTSTDFGNTWKVKPTSVVDYDFLTPTTGFAATFTNRYATIWYTEDAGNTWINQGSQESPSLNGDVVDVRSLAFRDSLHGFFTLSFEALDGSGGGDAGYYTADGGHNWTRSYSADTRLYLGDSTWIFGSLASRGFSKSYDDFRTNFQIGLDNIHPTAECLPTDFICKYDSLILSSVASGNHQILRSTDGGLSWYAQVCNHEGGHLERGRAAISTPSRLVGYAVGLDSQVYKTIDGGGAPFAAVAPSSLQDAVLQLSPNPAWDYLNVIGRTSDMRSELQILDLMGRVVLRTIVNSATLVLDIRSLPSGIYYVALSGQRAKLCKLR